MAPLVATAIATGRKMAVCWNGAAVMLHASLADTVASLGDDGEAYARLIGRTVKDWERLEPTVLSSWRSIHTDVILPWNSS